MFKRFRKGGNSGEKSGERIVDASERMYDSKLDGMIYPGMNHKLARELRRQNEAGTFAYSDELRKQRGDPPERPNGLPLVLGIVDQETGKVIRPSLNPPGGPGHDDDPGSGPKTPPPPPPTRAA